MYHIVASDMDGTLLSPEHKITPLGRETLQQLTEKGIHFVFATGRHHIDIGQIRDSLAIDAYMITSNGARVHNTAGELIFSHNLDEDIAAELFTLCDDRPNIVTNIYRDDEWYANRSSADHSEMFQQSVFPCQLIKMDAVPTTGVCKVYYTSDSHEALLPLEQQINQRWGDRVNVSFSLPGCLEVMAGGVSKGEALAGVAKLLGYRLEDCIAFGDGMNDQEMLTMAGKGCIMANAHQRLKDLLPHLDVIGSNVDDAVVHYLRHMYLG